MIARKDEEMVEWLISLFVMIKNQAFKKEKIETFSYYEERERELWELESHYEYYIQVVFTDGKEATFSYSNEEERDKAFMNLFNDMNK